MIAEGLPGPKGTAGVQLAPGSVPAKTYRLDGDVPTPFPEVAGGGLNGASRSLPQGAYTTFRTYFGDRVLCLDVHLARLESSARLLGSEATLDRRTLCRALTRIIAGHGYPESRLRITWAVPAGTMYCTISRFEPLSPEIYRTGVRCITRTMQRDRPLAKDTGFIAPSRQLKKTLPDRVFEVLMCTPSGEILEGLTSNFFAVQGDVLYTAGEGVLEGVTRRIVLSIAPRVLPVTQVPPSRDEISAMREAFVTSSSREIVPVVEIDGQRIGRGRPGPMTGRLLRRYRAFVRYAAQPVARSSGMMNAK
ncbi:MAG: hypothetical protein GXP41_02740 [Chloroflexi bacterium]|nr:hypothetical protein [Chloroflexota bacterium]